MAIPNLPKTQIRLATSVSFYTLREDAISLGTFFKSIFQPRTVLSAIQTQMKLLDGVVSFTDTQERTGTPRHELDSDIPGQPLEIMGSPLQRRINLRRAVLYKSDLIQILGYEDVMKQSGINEASLLSQQIKIPFIIIRHESAPEGSGVAATVTFFRQCLLTNLTREYAVRTPGSDPAVFEDAVIGYGPRQQITLNS